MISISENVTALPEPSFAIVDEILAGRLRIRWQATIWDAEIRSNVKNPAMHLSVGQSVSVIGIKGIKLIISV